VQLAVYVVWTRKISAAGKAKALREAAEVLLSSAGDGDDALERWAARVEAVPGSAVCRALPALNSFKGWLKPLLQVKFHGVKYLSGAGVKPDCQAALLTALANHVEHVGADVQVGGATCGQRCSFSAPDVCPSSGCVHLCCK
jgi:hypothetical protein